MSTLTANTDFEKTKAQRTIEFILFILCLSVIVLRATFTESPNLASANLPGSAFNNITSLSLSTALLLAIAAWLFLWLCSKKIVYHFSAIEPGIIIFLIAGAVSISIASNRRAAITGFLKDTHPFKINLRLLYNLSISIRLICSQEPLKNLYIVKNHIWLTE